jgi:hypothetical protein
MQSIAAWPRVFQERFPAAIAYYAGCDIPAATMTRRL